jgi:hypothetical protein
MKPNASAPETCLKPLSLYLMEQAPARVIPLNPMGIDLPNGMELRVSPVWARHFSPTRLLVLHFWREPLSDWQLKAAPAILIAAMKRDKPTCLDLDLDFISVAVPDHATKRRLRTYSFDTLKPLDDDELQRFLQRLCDAWAEYQRRGPRAFKSRSRPSLFHPESSR